MFGFQNALVKVGARQYLEFKIPKCCEQDRTPLKYRQYLQYAQCPTPKRLLVTPHVYENL